MGTVAQGKDKSSTQESLDFRVSDADDLYRAGRCEEVLSLAGDASLPTDITSRVRLLIVRGMAEYDLGDAISSLRTLSAAAAQSHNSDHRLEFDATFAHFVREIDFVTPEQTLPALSRLRLLACQVGSAPALAGLHLAVARLEGLRGHCINAQRHVQIARRFSEHSENKSVACLVDLIEASMECVAGNLRRAKTLAEGSLMRANSLGFTKYVVGSLSNLAVVALYSGHPQKARSLIDQVLPLSEHLTYAKFGTLDSLAQVELSLGNAENCRALLEKCRSVGSADRLPARSWYDLAHQLTRCAYHERLEEWTRIIEICDGADPELARRQYKALRTALLCAKARALANLGQHAKAEQALATAVRACPRGAVDPLIVVEATKGVCGGLKGDTTKSATHFDRALAACRAIGHRYHEQWIDRERARLARATRESVAVGRHDLDVTDAALLMTDVAAILGAGHSIDLLSQRMAAILESTTIGERVVIENESGCEYVAEPASTWEADEHGTFCIRLRGSDRRVAIRVHGVQTIDEISLLKSVADLVQAAVNRTADTETEDENQNLWPRTSVANGEDTIFRSPQMVEFLKIAARLAAAELPILITGETGTGKEIIARLIHDYSRGARGPFVPFNCSAIPKDLVESQLFGHKRGAFTGALESFPGVTRAADRGTLFLDELGDLELMTQPKLLRFLESGEVHPVGDVRSYRVDVRIVAATNANLDVLVEQGRFRRDLYYRVGVARLALPPLRERKDEIPAFASLFLSRFSRECRRSGVRLGDDFIAALLLYDWPGNIRQLANEIRRAVAMAADGQTLHSTDLGADIVERWNARPTSVRVPETQGVFIRLDQDLARATGELEQRFIEHAMSSAGGRVADAAHLLGLSRKGLFLKRRRRGLLPH